MRAFIITVDALVALSFIFIAALLMYSQTFQPYAPRGVYLKQLTLDALTVMESDRALMHAVQGNGTGVRQLLQRTPDHVCMHVSITDSSGDVVTTIAKENCGAYGEAFQSVVMPTTYEGKPYMVMAHSWYRKEYT